MPRRLALGSRKRNAHLESTDFFDVEGFPVVTTATRVSKIGVDQLSLERDLSIHGVLTKLYFNWKDQVFQRRIPGAAPESDCLPPRAST